MSPVSDSAKGNVASVLIVEQDPVLGRAVSSSLSSAGCSCEVAHDVDGAISAVERGTGGVVVADVDSCGGDAEALLRRLRSRRADVAVVFLASDPTVQSAVAAMRHGAFDYLTKPVNDEELCTVVGRALEIGSLKQENRRLREQLDVVSSAAGFVAESPQSKALIALVRRVAPSRATVLIQGESGTGKELVARLVHYWSERASGPFVAVNCKAFAEGVVESELFGHERGSFTGAIASRAGCFERASGGTLFLDEISEAGPDFQAKLLRVLEDGEVLRVGANKSRKVDVRIVAATNRDLRAEVAAGRLRADLYFRLNVIPIKIPPLRKRPADILPLARHFLAWHSIETGRKLFLSADAEQALLAHSWPGNVRELQNAVERAVVISGAELLTVEAFALETDVPVNDGEVGEPGPEAPAARRTGFDGRKVAGGPTTLQESLDRAATERIKAALDWAKGNRALAAQALDVDRTTLYRLMKRLGVSKA